MQGLWYLIALWEVYPLLQVYTVRPGDSLWAIAQQFGVSVQSIIDLNNPPYPNRLTPGQSLIIRTDAEAPEEPAEPEEPAFQEYTVRSGDTIWQISRRFGVSMQDIIDLNNITNASRIYPGQVLRIPVPTQPPAPGQRVYVVRPGDSLWTISRRFGVSIDDILAANDLANPNLIYPGQELIIPGPGQPGPEPEPEPEPPVPDTPEYPAIVNGYLTAQGEPDRQRINAVGYALTYVSIFSFTFRPDGTLRPLNDRPALQAAQAEGIGALLTLTNIEGDMFSSELAQAILNDEQAQAALIDQLVDAMLTRGYVGLNIDFEYVFPEDREAFNQFMRNLKTAMEPEGLVLTSALAPKASAQQRGLLYEAHDYEAHGEIADYVILMTYEWGWVGGPPMAIAPLNQVRRILDYAVTVIPRNKILMGVPVYARDWAIPWVEGTRARTFSIQEAVRQAIDQGAAIEYDETAQSPFYHYEVDGQRHEVWLEDARSIDAKIETVKEYELAGVSLWTIYGNFPQLWPLLADRFDVQKPAVTENGD